jgi:hypothetical protein
MYPDWPAEKANRKTDAPPEYDEPQQPLRLRRCKTHAGATARPAAISGTERRTGSERVRREYCGQARVPSGR